MDEQQLEQARQALCSDSFADFEKQAPHLQQMLQHLPILSIESLNQRGRAAERAASGNLEETLALIKPKWRANNPPHSHEGAVCAVWGEHVDLLAVEFEATVWEMSSIQGGLTVARIGQDMYLLWPY